MLTDDKLFLIGEYFCSVTNSFQKEWESVSQSGYFNSLEWKQPIMLNKYYE